MTRPLLTPEAKGEVREAAAWYKQQRLDLGRDFIAEIRRQLGLIRERPRAFGVVSMPSVGFTLRRAVCRRFPYVLFFRETPRRIEILAVAHTSRLPGYWLDRPAAKT